jgi:Flp pilus assembly protein TadD
MPHFLAYVLISLFGLFTMALDPVMAAGTSDGSSDTATAPSYGDAKALIDAKDYAGALPLLEAITKAEPGNADAWNLRGFANRKLGNLDDAAKFYAKALHINPGHLGALEYQGEMFVQMKDLDRAKANLVKLQGLCGDCEQAKDLAAAIGS